MPPQVQQRDSEPSNDLPSENGSEAIDSLNEFPLKDKALSPHPPPGGRVPDSSEDSSTASSSGEASPPLRSSPNGKKRPPERKGRDGIPHEAEPEALWDPSSKPKQPSSDHADPSSRSRSVPSTPQPLRRNPLGEEGAGLTAGATEPYCLRAVGHSLGGANLLIHCLARQASRRPSHVHRLVLLTPAGYHVQMPPVSAPSLFQVSHVPLTSLSPIFFNHSYLYCYYMSP